MSVQGDAHVALASGTVPMADALGTPKQVHIALTDNLDEMAITYVTGVSDAAPAVRCVLYITVHSSLHHLILRRYGTSPAELVTMTTGSTSTYTASEICEDPANITAQVMDCSLLPSKIKH